MNRDEQINKKHKLSILVLSLLLIIIVVIDLLFVFLNSNKKNNIILNGNVPVVVSLFKNQQWSNLNFSTTEFYSQATITRIMTINNKSEDCYLRFYLISKVGDNESNMVEDDSVISLDVDCSYQSSIANTIVDNERYLVSSENIYYYKTDNNDKQSVFQKNTTASIELTFNVADLGNEYANKVFKFEIVVEAVKINDSVVDSWDKPDHWPNNIV